MKSSNTHSRFQIHVSDQQRLLSIERAQYEDDRAEQQFMLTDPEKRKSEIIALRIET